MKFYSVGELSDFIVKTPQKLIGWHKKGSLIPHHITDGGTMHYSQEQLNHFLGIKGIQSKSKKVIGYCRVSSYKQNHHLECQIDNVKTYMISKG